MSDNTPSLSITFDGSVAEVVETLRSAREAKAAATKEEKEARGILMALLHNAGAQQGLTASGQGVKISTQERTSISRDKLEAIYPEVYDKVVETKEVEVLGLI